MQERRLLTNIKREDIPSSAELLTTSNYNTLQGNVIYFPIYNGNFYSTNTIQFRLASSEHSYQNNKVINIGDLATKLNTYYKIVISTLSYTPNGATSNYYKFGKLGGLIYMENSSTSSTGMDPIFLQTVGINPSTVGPSVPIYYDWSSLANIYIKFKCTYPMKVYNYDSNAQNIINSCSIFIDNESI